MEYRVVKGDLFQTVDKYVLAHCVGRDMGLGAGVALQFRLDFPEMIEYLNENRPENYPDVVKWTGERTVYNLVTKELSTGKPTRESQEKALIKLKSKMIESGEKHLAIPMIGSFRDKLNWDETEDFIKDLFADTDIDIVVCVLHEPPLRR